jgi:hypothetical protein
MAEIKFNPVDFGKLIDDPMGVLGTRLEEAFPIIGKDPKDVTMRDILGLAFRSGGVGILGGSAGEHAAKEIGERTLRAGLGANLQSFAPDSIDAAVYPEASSAAEMRSKYQRRKKQQDDWFVGDDGRWYHSSGQELAPEVPRDVGLMRGFADDFLFMGIHSPDPNTSEPSLYTRAKRHAQQFMDPAKNPEWVNRVAESQGLTREEQQRLRYGGR